MGDKPDFAAQTSEPTTGDERRAWLNERCREFKAEGAQAARATLHESIPNLLLIEAWKNPRAEQGEPEFFLVDPAA